MTRNRHYLCDTCRRTFSSPANRKKWTCWNCGGPMRECTLYESFLASQWGDEEPRVSPIQSGAGEEEVFWP